MEKELTKKQKEVLNFIKKFNVEHSYPPSIREICAGLGLSSPATAHAHLKHLIDAGYIRKTGSKSRCLELLVDNEYEQKDENIIQVPLLGKVTAGNPIEAIQQPDSFFSLPATLVDPNYEVFTLEVMGESMINAGIYDGDIIIVKKQNSALNNQIVVAMNDEYEVTVKRFFKEKDHIRLQPENDTMSPIILNNCTILGIVIGLFRQINN